jgi:hypothetical protein
VKHGAKVKRCSSEGCKNIVKKGGVCVRHGAKVKLCRSEGFTNKIFKGGVCKKHGAKRYRYECSAEGCTNVAVKGGVCVRHGAKVKRCSVEGCTNQSQKGGVCCRHGAYRNPGDESTAFASCFGSEFSKTTATLPNQGDVSVSIDQGRLPVEVVVCGVIAENYEEV